MLASSIRPHTSSLRPHTLGVIRVFVFGFSNLNPVLGLRICLAKS